MSMIDIRSNAVPEPITRIVFSDSRIGGTTVANELVRSTSMNYVRIRDEDFDGGSDGYVVLQSQEQAENLIKAITKSIELGWFK